MLHKVKQWLGIEGVKIEVVIAEEFDKKTNLINGQVRFSSQHTQVVNNIKFKVIEKYTRGREDEMLVDEYLLGQGLINGPLEVPAESTVEMNFSIPIKREYSQMDELEESNFMVKSIVKLAKKFQNAHSTFRVEAVANIEGTALSPFSVKEFSMK